MVLGRGPLERPALARRQPNQPPVSLNRREQSVGLRQFACFYGFLRISFQGSDFRVVAWLSRCGCLKVPETLRDLDKLGSQPLWGDVVLAKNTQRGAHLAFVEVKFFLEEGDGVSLCR